MSITVGTCAVCRREVGLRGKAGRLARHNAPPGQVCPGSGDLPFELDSAGAEGHLDTVLVLLRRARAQAARLAGRPETMVYRDALFEETYRRDAPDFVMRERVCYERQLYRAQAALEVEIDDLENERVRLATSINDWTEAPLGVRD